MVQDLTCEGWSYDMQQATNALILTATLQPSSSVYELKRTDWGVRESDYLRSAQRWSTAVAEAPTTWHHVALCDNSPEISPADWERFQSKLERSSQGRIQPQRTPAVKAPSSDAPVQKGKCEADLLDVVVADLVANGVGRFTKVTGRLFVPNFSRVLYQDGGVSACITSRLNYADTRFFSMPTQLWSQWYRGMAGEVDELAGIFLEHVFCRRTLLAMAGGARFDGVRRLPHFVGTSASMGVDYGSARERVKRAALEVARLPLHWRSGLTL